ncbi:MAG: hypothetical protein HOD87_07405 [Gammaproteobacteria bacterium]|nr:hypothetical protein [Gammaproteobacteria bacterium]
MYLYKVGKQLITEKDGVDMGELGVGAGLASLAFWGFIAAAVVATYWDTIRKREVQHETLRRLIESGQDVNDELVDKVLNMGSGNGRVDRDFKVTAFWIMPVAPGLAAFAYILGTQVPEAQTPLMGAAALLAVLGIGFYIAGKVLERWYVAEQV